MPRSTPGCSRRTLASVENDPELLHFATAGGAAVFRNYCSPCHGAGAGGVVGRYPNLLDDDWLWGGTAADIQQTVTHGIRYEADPDTRFSQMPAFGDILQPQEIDGLAAVRAVALGPGRGPGGRRGVAPALRRQLRLLPRRRTAPAAASSARRT